MKRKRANIVEPLSLNAILMCVIVSAKVKIEIWKNDLFDIERALFIQINHLSCLPPR